MISQLYCRVVLVLHLLIPSLSSSFLSFSILLDEKIAQETGLQSVVWELPGFFTNISLDDAVPDASSIVLGQEFLYWLSGQVAKVANCRLGILFCQLLCSSLNLNPIPSHVPQQVRVDCLGTLISEDLVIFCNHYMLQSNVLSILPEPPFHCYP